MIYLTYIFMFVLWLGTISKHNSFRASLPLAFRIQNGLFSLILVTLGMLSYNTIALIVLHPSCIPVLFYIKVGSISPGVACGVKITMAVVDAFCLSVGFWMIQLKEKGFRAARLAAPLFLLVNYAGCFLSAQRYASDRSYHSLLLLQFVFLFSFWMWLFLFSNSRIIREGSIFKP